MVGTFYEALDAQAEQGRFLCVGLDPDPSKMPEKLNPVEGGIFKPGRLFSFCAEVVEATHDVASVLKPNSAFFEQFGNKGVWVLERLIEFAKRYPDLIVTVDGKRGDIGNTAEAYAKGHFDVERADALTISPYLGRVASEPFLRRSEKGLWVLARTSNDGASEFQDLPITADLLAKTVDAKSRERIYADETIEHLVSVFDGQEEFPLYAVVAAQSRFAWNGNSNVGVVAGATYPGELEIVRAIVGEEVPILIPGVGAQGGEADEAALLGSNTAGRRFTINSSRGIIHASSGADFAEKARQAAISTSENILVGLAQKGRAA